MQSGATARDFASKHGVSASALSWWKWRLIGSGADRGKTSPQVPAREPMRLVPVEVVSDDAADDERWELHCAAGHVLRVHGRPSREQLQDVLVVMFSPDGER